MTTPQLTPPTAEDVDDTIRRLGHVRAALDAEYHETQARLQVLGGRRAAVEDAILIAAAHGRLLGETALVPLRSTPISAAEAVRGNDGAP